MTRRDRLMSRRRRGRTPPRIFAPESCAMSRIRQRVVQRQLIGQTIPNGARIKPQRSSQSRHIKQWIRPLPRRSGAVIIHARRQKPRLHRPRAIGHHLRALCRPVQPALPERASYRSRCWVCRTERRHMLRHPDTVNVSALRRIGWARENARLDLRAGCISHHVAYGKAFAVQADGFDVYAEENGHDCGYSLLAPAGALFAI